MKSYLVERNVVTQKIVLLLSLSLMIMLSAQIFSMKRALSRDELLAAQALGNLDTMMFDANNANKPSSWSQLPPELLDYIIQQFMIDRIQKNKCSLLRDDVVNLLCVERRTSEIVRKYMPASGIEKICAIINKNTCYPISSHAIITQLLNTSEQKAQLEKKLTEDELASFKDDIRNLKNSEPLDPAEVEKAIQDIDDNPTYYGKLVTLHNIFNIVSGGSLHYYDFLLPNLIRMGFPVDGFSPYNTTPLIECILDHSPQIEIVARSGAQIDRANNRGETPLICATCQSDTDTFVSLVRKGASIYPVSDNGSTLLHCAALGKAINIINFLYRHIDIDAQNDYGNTALMSLLILRNDDIVGDEDLIRRDREKSENTAIALIENGANVNKPNNTGDTPLLIAVVRGYAAVVETLLAYYADVNVANNGITALHIAARLGGQVGITMMNCLLYYGANPDAQTEQGDTPLMLAVRNGDLRAVELLLNYSADIDKQNHFGQAPSSIATPQIKTLLQRRRG